MKVTGPQAISELREKLQLEVGRHLYAVLGTYSQLDLFERVDLAQARDANGQSLRLPINLNRELLARIGDSDLNELVRIEARYPTAVENRLNGHLRELITECLTASRFIAIKHLELIYAYGLDLGIFRTLASNQNHILLLLPGTRFGQRITLFHEAELRFQRVFPASLLAENHLWELRDD